MKPLSDLSCFKRNPPPAMPIRQPGSRFYLKSHREYVNTYILTGSPLLSVLNMYEVHQLELAQFRRLQANFLSVEYVQKGNLAVRKGDRGFVVEPGEIALLQPFGDDEIMTGPAGFCHKTSIMVSGTLLPAILEASNLNNTDVLLNVSALRFEQLLSPLKELAESKGAYALEQNELLCFKLLQFLRDPEDELKIPPPLIKLYAFMEDDFAEDLSLDDMALKCGYSKVFLNREFRRYFKETPYRMLVLIRMRQAAILLQTRDDLSIKEIARLSGFSDPLNFSTSFRKQYGISPRAYRLNMSFQGYRAP